MNPLFPYSEGVQTNQERIYETGSEETTSFGDITDNGVDIGETEVPNQDLASPKKWVTTLILQKETMLRPLTNDEIINTIIELCEKLQNDFINTLDIVEQGNEVVNLLKKCLLTIFAATGHVHYTKSARLYLQLIMKLERLS